MDGELPEKLAMQLFGQPKYVSSKVLLQETPGGFVIEYGRIPIHMVVLILGGTYIAMGILSWVYARDTFPRLMSFGILPVVGMIILFAYFNKERDCAPSLVKFDSANRTVTIDSSESFKLSELECVFDLRGDIKGGSCYRQAVALVNKPEGRFLYRLIHQCNDGHIRDKFVSNIATRWSVGCRVFDGVKFERPEKA